MSNAEGVRAAQAQRLRFLHALYDRELSGEHMPNVQAVAKQLGIDGDDWIPIQGITEPLRQDRLIDGVPAAGVGLVRVRLTAEGRRHVEDAVGANDSPPVASGPASVGDIRIDGSGNVVNIAQHSPGGHQQADFTAFDLREMTTWLDRVERALPDYGLQDPDRFDAEQQLAVVREELQRERPNVGRLHAAGGLLVRILGKIAPSLATSGIVETGKALFLNR